MLTTLTINDRLAAYHQVPYAFRSWGDQLATAIHMYRLARYGRDGWAQRFSFSSARIPEVS